MRKQYFLHQFWFSMYLNISPNKHVAAYIMCMLLNVTVIKETHASHCIICSFLFAVSLLHSQAEALQSSRALWKARFLVITGYKIYPHIWFCCCSSFILGFLFIGSFVLICLDWNILSFFYLPLPLFIANSNGAKVVCHSLDPLWAVHTTGTFLLVSSTPRR